MSYANPLLERPARPAPRRVGVIGAGSIGPDIAYYLKSAIPGLELTLIDIRQDAIDAATAGDEIVVNEFFAGTSPMLQDVVPTA